MTLASEVCAWLRRVAPAGAELRVDSRDVGRGDVFVAMPGARVDGRRFVSLATLQGAAAVLVEAQDWQPVEVGVPLLPCAGLAAALGAIANLYYGRPSERLLTIGVTGTNGKTSCTFWIAQLLAAAGRRCGVIGTLGAGFPSAVGAGFPTAPGAPDRAAVASAGLHRPADGADGALELNRARPPAHDRALLTTPDAASLHSALHQLLRAGASAVALEVSSIGLDQGRVDAVAFDIALFTNLTRDHLDYHGTMQAYELAKASLLGFSTLTHAVLNLDDGAGCRYAAAALRRGVRVIGYGLAPAAELRARLVGAAPDEPALAPERGYPGLSLLAGEALAASADGLRFAARLRSAAGDDLGSADAVAQVRTGLIGTFNASNLLGVIGVALCAGVPLETACACCAGLQAPPGRMQRVVAADVAADAGAAIDGTAGAVPAPLAIVDYAHTPDALDQAIRALLPLAAQRHGQLWVVFGAGGERDTGKRSAMGEVAARLAHRVVLTSDNPRAEDPTRIIEQIAQGARTVGAAGAPVARLVDRAAAIAHALQRAAPSDVVLIAGKGHEAVQETRGRRRPFSDLAHAAAALAARKQQDQRP